MSNGKVPTELLAAGGDLITFRVQTSSAIEELVIKFFLFPIYYEMQWLFLDFQILHFRCKIEIGRGGCRLENNTAAYYSRYDFGLFDGIEQKSWKIDRYVEILNLQ